MKKGQIISTLTLSLFVASVAWAQGDENQPPAPAPVPAFGQENPVPTVSENPPISAIDQPGLEPHAAPESFLLPGLHFSESVDSNIGNTIGGGASVGSVTRGLGSLTLQKLWKNYDVAMDYIGGAAYYSRKGIGLEQLQQFDLDNRINWKRGQLAIRDSFSYLPEGSFGFGAYGGSGAYNMGLGGLGAGMLGASAFGGANNAFTGGGGVSLGHIPRLSNVGLADIVENLSPKSAVTLAAGYGIVHFFGSIDAQSLVGGVTQANINFIGSREFTAQVGYDRVLSAKDQVALSYGYQAFDFSTTGTSFHSHVLQAMYGHRISGRMDFTIGAGPQFTHIEASGLVCSVAGVPVQLCPLLGGTLISVPQGANHLGVAGRASLRYRFPKTSLALTYQRYNTSGNGVFAGAQSDIAHLDVRRPLSRIWDVFADFGYAKNKRLQLTGSAVNANKLSYGYAGVGLHRQFGRSLRGFVSYQFNDLAFDTACPLPAASSGSTTVSCSNNSQRHVGSIGVDWTPRPIRLD
ncbi:MAG TPA: hypothetical protein VNX26_03070 [Candidatus Acidoferrum sp.]|jgi:hypothetical protein|nr:hypothetical protein [Candidatus Acidoferrum sp.]